MPNIWHVELELAPGEIPFCTGDCPKSAVCEEDSVENPDGTIEIICTVVDVVSPPTVTPIGPRYLEVTPAAGESEVALLVTSDDEPCVSLYVQAPETINGNVIGRLGANPVLLTPAEWGTVNVSDEAILPGTIYGVQTELADATLSGPSTATTWLWADANNSGGTVDFDDILCILEGFADNYAGACSFFGADIEGGVTNVTIDFDDVLAALDTFACDGYFDNPTHVDPCP